MDYPGCLQCQHERAAKWGSSPFTAARRYAARQVGLLLLASIENCENRNYTSLWEPSYSTRITARTLGCLDRSDRLVDERIHQVTVLLTKSDEVLLIVSS